MNEVSHRRCHWRAEHHRPEFPNPAIGSVLIPWLASADLSTSEPSVARTTRAASTPKGTHRRVHALDCPQKKRAPEEARFDERDVRLLAAIA
jgi:hypothetical protein